MGSDTSPQEVPSGDLGQAAAAMVSSLSAEMVALARFLYDLRGLRHSFISADLLGEPAWDMLLDLYLAASERRRLSVSALCIGSRAAAATALRYLGLLEDEGLAERRRDNKDARRCFVALTPVGVTTMERILASRPLGRGGY